MKNILKHLRIFFSNQPYWSIGLVFGINSLLFGSWVTRIPDVKENLSLNDAELGTALLGLPIGSISGMLVTGWLIKKIGVGRLTVLSTLVFSILMIFPVSAGNFTLLMVALIFQGLSTAIMDIAMNDSASYLEKRDKVRIMSTCHGFWSLGGMIGAAAGSFIAGIKFPAEYHMMAMVVLMILLLISIKSKIGPLRNDEDQGVVFAIPSRSLVLLSCIAFCILLNEGAIADWSALYFKYTLLSNEYITGLGYAGFSFAMALGRFSGDSVIPIFGDRKILILGGLISTISLALALLAQNQYIALFGFFMTGLGFSCIVPILFRRAAKTPGLSSGASIAAVTTLGYTGFLIGPPFIGYIAHHFSLTIGLSIVVALSAFVSLLSMRIRN